MWWTMLMVVLSIGEQRKPMSPAVAAVTLALCGINLAVILHIGGVW